jgi:hypothetical protein
MPNALNTHTHVCGEGGGGGGGGTESQCRMRSIDIQQDVQLEVFMMWVRPRRRVCARARVCVQESVSMYQ